MERTLSSALSQSHRNLEMSPLHCLPNPTLLGSARQAVFPPVQVAPEGSPTGYHSADLAETFIQRIKP
jgi:hypothetical protein